MIFNYDPFKDNNLINIESYVGRLQGFLAMTNLKYTFENKSVLVFGSAFGGECFAVSLLGANDVVGLEISDSLIIESIRLKKEFLANPQIDFHKFDGNYWKSSKKFDVVISAHVIEHVANPKLHLTNLLNTCNSAGLIFIEFPTRFNLKELHTGLLSFEYLPKFIRYILNYASSKVHLLLGDVDKSISRMSINSTLNQISTFFIRRNLVGTEWKILAKHTPAKGFVRLILVQRGAKGI